MLTVLAVLLAVSIILSAPLDPTRRLRELLPTPGGGNDVGVGGGGSRGRARRQDPEQEKLWAIGTVENAAHLLKVGMTPQAVMATLSRQNEDLGPISRAISLGEEPGRAIVTRSSGMPPAAAEVMAGMAAVWTVSERSGAPAADMILRYAAAQRDALDADRERRIAMAGPRSTVRVLSWLPLIGVGLGLLIGVRPAELIAGLPGQLSVGLGLLLYVLGRWWMTAMMRSAER